MISAFGVEHQISKSMLPGGRFVPASKLSAIGRGKNRALTEARRTLTLPKGQYIQGSPVKGVSAKGRSMYEDGGSHRGMGQKVHTDVQTHEHVSQFGNPSGGDGGTLLAHSQPNGKGGGLLRMDPNQPGQEQTYKHEMAHLKPKRNPVRLFERTSTDTKRLGREEGRADFIGQGKKTPGRYPGDHRFQEGYDEVQTKMHRASQRPKKNRRFIVDSKGVAVQKSAFGITHGKIKALKPTAKLPEYLKTKDKEPVKYPLSRNRK